MPIQGPGSVRDRVCCSTFAMYYEVDSLQLLVRLFIWDIRSPGHYSFMVIVTLEVL